MSVFKSPEWCDNVVQAQCSRRSGAACMEGTSAAPMPRYVSASMIDQQIFMETVLYCTLCQHVAAFASKPKQSDVAAFSSTPKQSDWCMLSVAKQASCACMSCLCSGGYMGCCTDSCRCLHQPAGSTYLRRWLSKVVRGSKGRLVCNASRRASASSSDHLVHRPAHC